MFFSKFWNNSASPKPTDQVFSLAFARSPAWRNIYNKESPEKYKEYHVTINIQKKSKQLNTAWALRGLSLLLQLLWHCNPNVIFAFHFKSELCSLSRDLYRQLALSIKIISFVLVPEGDQGLGIWKPLVVLLECLGFFISFWFWPAWRQGFCHPSEEWAILKHFIITKEEPAERNKLKLSQCWLKFQRSYETVFLKLFVVKNQIYFHYH